MLLSRDGTLAAIATVAFDREAGKPARVVRVIDLSAGRVAWRRTLPSPTCCAFPVLAMTPDGDTLIVGGAEETVVYDRRGTPLFAAGLNDGRLHSAVDIDDAGRVLAVGEWEGTLAAFEVGRGRLWVRRAEENVMAMVVSGKGGVMAAALRNHLLILRLRDGTVLHNMRYGPARIAAVAISVDGDRVGLVWKHDDGRMVTEAFAAGRRRWRRDLGPGSVPLLQMDGRGRWLAVGDLLGRQAALLSSSGETLWKADGRKRAAVAVNLEGRRFAVALGAVVEVRELPSGRVIWQSRAPGVVHLLRLAGRRLAVLGAVDPDAGTPDRIWFADMASPRE